MTVRRSGPAKQSKPKNRGQGQLSRSTLSRGTVFAVRAVGSARRLAPPPVGIAPAGLVVRLPREAIDVQAHHVAHVERSGADLRRGGRHRGRAAGAGVSVASRTSLPLRRDGHTKVYAGDQKSLCDRTHV